MSLSALRATSESISSEKQRANDRKKGILVLINQFLIENGYLDSAERLQSETSNIAGKYDLCDNIDLALILNEYEAYYEMRFDKKPKILKKSANDGSESSIARGSGRSAAASNKSKTTGKEKSENNNSESKADTKDNGDEFGVSGTSVSLVSNNKSNNNTKKSDKIEDRILKPPPQFGGDVEMKQLAMVISREIYQESPNIHFDDIVKLDEAKRLLAEAVQLPLKFPALFTGILRPWKGILLHGPPGTGKTLLAKAVATECNTTFFNISASTLVSKWRGDSEKLVRALFELARYHAPSTIFLDEIDSILTSRSGAGDASTEHEASRRMKTELLIQMDGVTAVNSSVFVMAASNLPWDLDVALLRRLEKRLMIGLPELEAREVMVRKHLADRSSLTNADYTTTAGRMEGYSGADIELVCREAAMMPVRRLITKITSNVPEIPLPPTGSSKASSNRGRYTLIANSSVSNSEVDGLLKQDPVTLVDVTNALETTKPSSDNSKMGRYIQWQNEFGSV